MKNPEVNPQLVTLPDSGALPATTNGTNFAWFGNVDSGTFCGPDFANRDAPPETTITSGPSGTVPSTDATFEFTASEQAFFECQLDNGGFLPCFSPQTYSNLALGSHTFQVRATDFTGNADPTPDSRTWTVREKTLNDLDNPTQGVDVNVDQVSGIVLVGVRGAAARAARKEPGARTTQKGVTFVPLSEARQVPVGSFLDTRRGTVRLQSARDRLGTRQTGTFLNSLFQVRQSRKRTPQGPHRPDPQGRQLQPLPQRRQGQADAPPGSAAARSGACAPTPEGASAPAAATAPPPCAARSGTSPTAATAHSPGSAAAASSCATSAANATSSYEPARAT